MGYGTFKKIKPALQKGKNLTKWEIETVPRIKIFSLQADKKGELCILVLCNDEVFMIEGIQELTDSNFSSKIASGLMLVDFFAEWCGPCRMMSPVLEQVAKDVKGKASVGKIDIDAEQKTAAQFQVTSIPTLILFKDGKEVNRLVGLRDGETIKKFILAAI